MGFRTGVLVASAALLAASTVAAETDALKPDLDYGATGGRPPRTATVSARPNQIAVSKVIGQTVFARGSGRQLGKITDVFLDSQGRLALAKIDNAAVPWSSLEFQGKPSPRFVAGLEPDDLKNAPQPRQGKDLRDVKNDILGKKAVDANGAEFGTVHDLVATVSEGTIAAVAIQTGSALKNKQEHAVAWKAVKGAPKDGQGLVIALSADQVREAPVMMTKAPEGFGGDPRTNPAEPQKAGSGQPTQSGSSAPPLGTATVGPAPMPADKRR